LRQVLAVTLGAALAQPPAPAQTVFGQQPGSGVTQLPSPTLTERFRPSYVLGPGDQLLIRAFEMPEISDRVYRIDGDGNINVPVLGKIPAGGRRIEQLEADMLERLRQYVRTPQVTITVVQYRSEPVFFVGAFRAPGIYPLEGARTLVEMLSVVGGLQPYASRRIKITRRKEFGTIPLPGAQTSPDGEFSTAEITIGSLRGSVSPTEDIALQPFDVLTAERAEMIYVAGAVRSAGGFEPAEREYLTVLQVLAMAGGLAENAKPKKARILRPVLDTSRRAEIPINLERILQGKDSDFRLMPNDTLYVPAGVTRSAVLWRVLPLSISLASLMVILIDRL
jgi:polysaccharide export outer membrane protein